MENYLSCEILRILIIIALFKDTYSQRIFYANSSNFRYPIQQ